MSANCSVGYIQNNIIAKLSENLHDLSSFITFAKLYLFVKKDPYKGYFEIFN